MLTLRTFKTWCKKICPEWQDYNDWHDGEFWISFTSRSDQAICMYQYKDFMIYMPNHLKLGKNTYGEEECMTVDENGEVIRQWEDGIIIDATEPDARKKLVNLLYVLHQDYKQYLIEKRAEKIKEDF